MNQNNMILEHMMRIGPITPKEAEERYGIMRLGARIYDLKHLGHRIDREWATAPNRFGELTRFARYIYRGSDE